MSSNCTYVATLAALLGLAVVGCDDNAGSQAEVAGVVEAEQASTPDARLQTHEIVPSTPTADGLAYIRAVAAIHAEADAPADAPADADGSAQRVAALQRGLALPVPEGLPEAEILRLGLATRLASAWIEGGEAQRAQDLLAPMLAPSRSVPLDRASAEALVLLGDAATRTGDDALAAGSYGRSIRMMSILRQELE